MRRVAVLLLAVGCLTGCNPTCFTLGPGAAGPAEIASGPAFDPQSPAAQNEFTFWNGADRDIAAVRVEWGDRVVELGPVPGLGHIRRLLPAGADGYFYVSWEWVNGGEGGNNVNGPDFGPMVGQRIEFAVSSRGMLYAATRDRPASAPGKAEGTQCASDSGS